MRKPKRLIGYVKYDELDYPFEFNEETFSLLLFPPTVEVWAHTSSIFNLLSGFKDDVQFSAQGTGKAVFYGVVFHVLNAVHLFAKLAYLSSFGHCWWAL